LYSVEIAIYMNKKYIIVTPAYNESRYIAATIEGVIRQTIQPLLWVIVDDDSTDQTADIVNRYAAGHPWIQYAYRPKDTGQSYYGSNVYAIKAGYEQVRNIDYDFMAILDADISLPKDYYEQILERMETDSKLGIASGVYVDRIGENKYRKILNDRRSTPKGLMLFRKECYEAIGGFLPMKYGGEDTCACFMARMRDWKTWSFPDIVAVHNRPVGGGHAGNIMKIRFRLGLCDWGCAFAPAFMILKCLRRCIKEHPFILGGMAHLAGFFYGYFLFEKRQLPKELVKFIRNEQKQRILAQNKVPQETIPQGL
jgi:poly-beta-1,6-N-acetyl-D-glucosamine synthase